MKIFELQPNSSRKSFYGKCKVIDNEEGKLTLISYTTKIAYYIKNENRVVILEPELSSTSRRHLSAFLVYCGFDLLTKDTDLTEDIQGNVA
jgi:hypothetical protein